MVINLFRPYQCLARKSPVRLCHSIVATPLFSLVGNFSMHCRLRSSFYVT